MKQTKQQAIPVHRMDSQSPFGMEFGYFEVGGGYVDHMMNSPKNIAHRDDYYMFWFIDRAEVMLIVDFEEMRIVGNSVMYIRPGQVHFASSIQDAKGWLLVIDPMLVEKCYKNTFEAQFLTQRPVALDSSVSARMSETARLLHTAMNDRPTVFSNGININLANVFIGTIAEQYAGRQKDSERRESRQALIAHRFRELLTENFKTLKSPIQYAEALNYSLSHLNGSVKSVTGFPVSHWIHQQVALEAKRLLYYTDLNVKEIAFSLGYEDHTYFSRLFSRAVGVSPGAFRRKFHE